MISHCISLNITISHLITLNLNKSQQIHAPKFSIYIPLTQYYRGDVWGFFQKNMLYFVTKFGKNTSIRSGENYGKFRWDFITQGFAIYFVFKCPNIYKMIGIECT